MTSGRMRLYNPEWNNVTDPTLLRKIGYPMVFELFYSAAPSANATEFGGAANNALNGTTTPVILYVASSSATDHDAANGAVRAIQIIGITVANVADYVAGRELPQYSVEEVRLDAADGTTDVTTSRYYLRVIHAYACEWGTGGGASHDAEGNITVSDDAVPTNTYLTIAAGDNDSNNGGLIYVHDGYWGQWKSMDISVMDAAYNNT